MTLRKRPISTPNSPRSSWLSSFTKSFNITNTPIRENCLTPFQGATHMAMKIQTRPRRLQKAPVLFDRCRRQPHAARWPLHRKARAPTTRCCPRTAKTASRWTWSAFSTGWTRAPSPPTASRRFLEAAGVAAKKERSNPNKADPGTKAKERAEEKGRQIRSSSRSRRSTGTGSGRKSSPLTKPPQNRRPRARFTGGRVFPFPPSQGAARWHIRIKSASAPSWARLACAVKCA